MYAKMIDIRNAQYATSTDPLVRELHEAAKVTRSQSVITVLQHSLEAYMAESSQRHSLQYPEMAESLISPLVETLVGMTGERECYQCQSMYIPCPDTHDDLCSECGDYIGF